MKLEQVVLGAIIGAVLTVGVTVIYNRQEKELDDAREYGRNWQCLHATGFEIDESAMPTKSVYEVSTKLTDDGKCRAIIVRKGDSTETKYERGEYSK